MKTLGNSDPYVHNRPFYSSLDVNFCREHRDKIEVPDPLAVEDLRTTFWERRESEDTHQKSIFLLFRQNIPLGELTQGKIV